MKMGMHDFYLSHDLHYDLGGTYLQLGSQDPSQRHVQGRKAYREFSRAQYLGGYHTFPNPVDQLLWNSRVLSQLSFSMYLQDNFIGAYNLQCQVYSIRVNLPNRNGERGKGSPLAQTLANRSKYLHKLGKYEDAQGLAQEAVRLEKENYSGNPSLQLAFYASYLYNATIYSTGEPAPTLRELCLHYVQSSCSEHNSKQVSAMKNTLDGMDTEFRSWLARRKCQEGGLIRV